MCKDNLLGAVAAGANCYALGIDVKRTVLVAGKAMFYFVVLGIALPLLLDRRLSPSWIIGSVCISLAITVLPAYLIARLSDKKAKSNTTAVTGRWTRIIVSVLERKWVRVAVIAVGFFVLMTFIVPAIEGRPLDTAWVIISAIAAIIGAVVGDYLNEKQTARKARKTRRHE